MSRFTRTVLAGLVATGSWLALAVPAAVAAPASATATAPQHDCRTGKTTGPPSRGVAYCTGTPWHRVKVRCVDPRGSQWYAHGPWMRSGQSSSVQCSANPNVGILRVFAEVRSTYPGP